MIISKRAQVLVSWFFSRQNFNFSAYQGGYTYAISNGRNQDLLGANLNWTWHFNPRTSAMISGFWQSSEYQGNSTVGNTRKTNYMSVSVGLTRQLNSFISSSLKYEYYKNDSSNLSVGNILGNLGAYDTNLVIATVNIRF